MRLGFSGSKWRGIEVGEWKIWERGRDKERWKKLGLVWEIVREFERKREQKMTINAILGLRGKSIAPKFPLCNVVSMDKNRFSEHFEI